MSSKSPSIFRNAIANWGAFLYVAAVSFFLSPIVVKSLGATGYGVWSLLVAVVGYLGLLDFGVRGAVTRYIAHHHAVRDLRSSSLIATAALVLFGMLGLLAIAISGALSWLSPVLFNIPAELVTDSRIVLLLGGFTIFATLIGAVYGGVVTGLERFDISSGIEVLLTTVRSAAVLIALKMGYGLVVLAWIHLLGSLLYGAGVWLTVRRILPGLRLLLGEPLMPHIRTILSFSAFLSMIHILGIVIYYTDTLVIASMLPISAVGIYAIAGNLTDYARKVASALSKMFTPRISAMKSAGSDQIVEAVLNGGRAATFVTLPIVITFLFRGPSFIGLWMGPEYGLSAGAVLQVFAFVVWVGSARAVAASAIIGVNMHRKLIPLLSFEAVCNLVLSLLLVRPLGVIGVAIGTLIPSLVVSLALVPRCLKQTIGVPVTAYYYRAVLLPTLACLPFAAITYLTEQYLPTAHLLVFFLQVAVAVPVALAGGVIVCLSVEERVKVYAKLRGFAPVG